MSRYRALTDPLGIDRFGTFRADKRDSLLTMPRVE